MPTHSVYIVETEGSSAKIHPAAADDGVSDQQPSLALPQLLEAELPDEQQNLLRGISTHHVMANNGAIFRVNMNTRDDRVATKNQCDEQQKKTDFERSVPASKLDSFLSHAWIDAWWKKQIALCFHFNLKAANTTGVCAAILLTVAGHAAYRAGAPKEVVVFVVTWGAHAAYVVILLYAQTLLPKLRRLCFLDKACIVQDDLEQMKAGVAALHVFLRKSRRMVIFWSPEYFKRLWCTWEVAVYAKLTGSDFSRIILIPLALGPFMAVASMLAISFVMIFDLFRIFGGFEWLHGLLPERGAMDRAFVFVQTATLAAAIAVYNYMFSMQVEQAAALGTQLRSFSLADARCFAEADRAKIVHDVAMLFGSEASFERYLVESFLPGVRKRMGSNFFPYPYKRAITVCFLHAGFGRLAVADSAPAAVFAFASYLLLWFGVNTAILTQVDVLFHELHRRFPNLLAKHRLKVSVAAAPFEALVNIPLSYFGSRWLVYQIVRAIWPGFARPVMLFPLVSTE